MYSIDSILAQLANVKDLDTIRWTVVALIREQLHDRRETLDDWEATHFANAISMLSMNVNSFRQPTSAWLRLCLVDLRHALTPPEGRPDTARASATGNEGDECITYAQLIDALDTVARQLDRRKAQAIPSATITLRRYLDRLSHSGMQASRRFGNI